ncbi:MAG TPA: TonB C-terminal domain-containing protein [Candidatus Obscuribacterales bacterium]
MMTFSALPFSGRRAKALIISSSLLSGQILFGFAPVATAQNKTLKGGVQKEGFIQPDNTGPRLSRSDINRIGDPFGDNEQFEPPKEAFAVQSASPDMPQKFGLNAQQTGDPFQGQSMPGLSDQVPQQQPVMQPPSVPQMAPPTQMPQMRPNDPDNSQEMQLAWDEWHRRVAEAIFTKIQAFAGTILKRSQPLKGVVAYTVTRDGQIVNVRMLQPSPNIFYNAIILRAITSTAGSPVLQFPMGSRRMVCEKVSTFSHNTGGPEGFRSIVGDRETMRVRGGGP